MASSIGFKESERPHSCTSFSYVHYKLTAEYHANRRLRIQDRPAGCILLCTNSSKQQEVPQVCLRKQDLSVSGTSFSLNTAPQIFTCLGHTVTGTVRLSSEIRAGVRYLFSRNSITSGLRGSLAPRVHSMGDSSTCVQSILLSSSVISSSVPIHGFTQLGLRSYPSGLFVPETITTFFSFLRPDRLLYAITSVRPFGPCQPTAAMAGPVFSYLRNPYPSVSGGIYNFYGCLHSVVGRPHGGFPDFGYLDPSGPRAPYHLLGTQGGRGRPSSLFLSASGPPGHDCYGQFDSSFIYQQARGDPVLYLAVSSSGAFHVVTSSEHSSPSKTHSRLYERDSRPPISSRSADNDRRE